MCREEKAMEGRKGNGNQLSVPGHIHCQVLRLCVAETRWWPQVTGNLRTHQHGLGREFYQDPLTVK